MTNSKASKVIHLDECFQQSSLISGLRCIASDWALKSQTNFYIPSNEFAGYSYLFDQVRNEDNEIQHGLMKLPHSVHDTSWFVRAHEHDTFNIHTHHPLRLSTLNQSFVDIRSRSIDNSTPELHEQERYIRSSLKFYGESSHQPMTIPYMHPHLDLPVPPLQLPCYFGALCFSFSVAGLAALYWTPKWAIYGGGRKDSNESKQQRHWFPYRTFAWALILFQGPCSFLADYIYMTHISHWHMIDRFLASTLVFLELLKYVVMRPYTRPMIYVTYLIFVSMAMFCFMKSQEAQRNLDEAGFVFWHCGWHCYPLAVIGVCWLENWFIRNCGDYYIFGDKKSTQTIAKSTISKM